MITPLVSSNISCQYLHINIANEDRIRTIIYDKRIDFNFPIVNNLFICSIIPAAPVCLVYTCIYISQFVFILNFLNRGLLLTRKLLNQGLKLKPSLQRFKLWLSYCVEYESPTKWESRRIEHRIYAEIVAGTTTRN
jgi:hypothetical protein